MAVLHDVVSATYKGGYKIEVTIDDGKKGVVDLSKFAERGGVFKRFRDLQFFRAFKVNEELGALTWNDEVDIAPETLYAEATGTPLPEWMTQKESRASKRLQPASPSRRR
jgi:hypothetical protein